MINSTVISERSPETTSLLLLPRDARSAKRGIAIVNRPSICPSVCLSVTLMYRGRTGWTIVRS